MLKRLDPQIIKSFERAEEEEIGRRESEDMDKLKEAPAAPVLIEDDIPALEEVVEFGIARSDKHAVRDFALPRIIYAHLLYSLADDGKV